MRIYIFDTAKEHIKIGMKEHIKIGMKVESIGEFPNRWNNDKSHNIVQCLAQKPLGFVIFGSFWGLGFCTFFELLPT